jgi:predicted GIY-YIG superfamily endonuclease
MTWRIQHGIGYLLCFDVPFGHAAHYLGITDNLPHRLHDHEIGKGAKLTGYARKAGISWTLTRTWDDCNRDRERQLKQNRGTRYCPRCKQERQMSEDPEYWFDMNRARAIFQGAISDASTARENAVSKSAGTPAWNAAVQAAQQELRAAREKAAQDWEARKETQMTTTPEEQEEAWRVLPEDATAEQAAELQDTLERGYKRAYEAAHEAFNEDPWGAEYEARFQTAAECNEVGADVAHETLERGFRKSGEMTEEFLARAQAEGDRERELASARESGADTAHQLVLGWAEAGMPVDEIERRQHDLITELLGDTKTEAGKAWAQAYRDTTDTYVRELREMGQAPQAKPVDPRLAAKGWQRCTEHPGCNVMVRRDPEPDLEAAS